MEIDFPATLPYTVGSFLEELHVLAYLFDRLLVRIFVMIACCPSLYARNPRNPFAPLLVLTFMRGVGLITAAIKKHYSAKIERYMLGIKKIDAFIMCSLLLFVLKPTFCIWPASVLLGGALNLAANAANDWRMPVDATVRSFRLTPKQLRSYHFATEKTRFRFLIDRFRHRFFAFNSVFSLGDIIGWIGITVSAAQYAIAGLNNPSELFEPWKSLLIATTDKLLT